MSGQQRAGAAAEFPPGKVAGVGRYAVGNAGGRYFAVTRRCRHLGADLAGGSIDENGCLVCPPNICPLSTVELVGGERTESAYLPAAGGRNRDAGAGVEEVCDHLCGGRPAQPS
jgi:Rieske [2Fe-2S] domain